MTVFLHRPAGRAALDRWILDVAAHTRAEEVRWYHGSDDEWQAIVDQMTADGSLIHLDETLRPGSYLARSDPADVARVEDRTYICSVDPDDAGPTNHWRDPAAMQQELSTRMAGAMIGRTMWVIPYSMGPVAGPLSQLGVQLTDSPYAVVSMAIMARTGDEALAQIDRGDSWILGVHSVGVPLPPGPSRSVPPAWPSNPVKIIAHFPESRQIWSYGSGYGGNALLAKKCHALRIASAIGREEGWLAEHMLLIRVTDPAGRQFHLAAAFPSACGKTNFAMLQPTLPDWQVETIGDDIAWLRPDPDGRLHAINPETGFFGVAPGTSHATNPAAIATISQRTVFTNTALTADGDIWWEGLTATPPKHLTDWQGQPWNPASGGPAAHPNARFTAPAEHCPTLAEDWNRPDGVPIDAIIFGGRRATTIPLVTEAADWIEGVLFGATIASEQTAAAEGTPGVLRRDPFAMLPFCGYNMADHWQHWLDIGQRLGPAAPKIFRVNWFRKDDTGHYLWPGFGDNIRVIDWITRRLLKTVGLVHTAAGHVPELADLDLSGLALTTEQRRLLLAADPEEWSAEYDDASTFMQQFESRTPALLTARLDARRSNLYSIKAPH